MLIEDSWVHDLRNGPDQHNDGMQSTGGKGVTLRNNWISGASNAAVQTGDEGAATEDLTLECNWFGGGGWTLNIRGSGATVAHSNARTDAIQPRATQRSRPLRRLSTSRRAGLGEPRSWKASGRRRPASGGAR